MSRIKIQMPPAFSFRCEIPVRITDLNYGGHAGNDTILSLVHEARMQFLSSLGYTEMNIEGVGTIMADAAIEFRSELFYPERILVSVQAAGFSKVGFDLYYQVERQSAADSQQPAADSQQQAAGSRRPTANIQQPAGRPQLVALVKTGMICYDYARKKIVSLPGGAREKLGA
jgi:acyl-CoA thioesterase FadM